MSLQIRRPTLAFCGATGAGKSSLVNALMRAKVQQVGDIPTTKETISRETTLGVHDIPVYIMDTPGLEEVGVHAQYVQSLREVMPQVDILVWVVGYDNRALSVDKNILTETRTNFPDKPILVLGTALDRVSRSFDPQTFDVDKGQSHAERAVREWLEYMRRTFVDAHVEAVLPCAAGESHDDTARQYNLQHVAETIERLLPVATRARWIECERVLKNKGDKARRIVLAATATSGGIGLIPLPMADLPFIVATQVGMIVSLCHMYGRMLSADTAKSLALAALSAVAGPMLFQTFSKLIPGLGSAIGGGVAAGWTFAVGKVTQAILEEGEEFELEAFKAAVKNVYAQYRQELKG